MANQQSKTLNHSVYCPIIQIKTGNPHNQEAGTKNVLKKWIAESSHQLSTWKKQKQQWPVLDNKISLQLNFLSIAYSNTSHTQQHIS